MSGPDVHGGRGRAVAAALGLDPDAVLDLSASLNPVAPDAARVVRDLADAVGWYPDATDATRALAEAVGVPSDRLVLTNGGAEAIALVASLHPAGWVEEPEFSLYRRHLARLDDPARRWRSNPGNPGGALAAPTDRAFLWDEAFFPLATGRWSRGDVGAWRLGSLTKVWACPGLRLGYVVAPSAADADAVRSRQPAWAVSSLAAAAVPVLLDQTDLPGWAKQVRDLTGELVDLLRADGQQVEVADAPWVLVPDAGDLAERLLRRGIVVRDCTSFGLPGTVRIATPDDAGLARLAAALAGTR